MECSTACDWLLSMSTCSTQRGPQQACDWLLLMSTYSTHRGPRWAAAVFLPQQVTTTYDRATAVAVARHGSHQQKNKMVLGFHRGGCVSFFAESTQQHRPTSMAHSQSVSSTRETTIYPKILTQLQTFPGSIVPQACLFASWFSYLFSPVFITPE